MAGILIEGRRYVRGHPISKTCLSDVYVGFDEQTRERVVIKQLTTEPSDYKPPVSRFRHGSVVHRLLDTKSGPFFKSSVL